MSAHIDRVAELERSVAELERRLAAKSAEHDEALAQQTATAEVLNIISRSAFDLDLAASTILEAAARLCRASLATLHLRDGGVCRLATQFGLPESFEREARRSSIPVKYPLHIRRPAQAGEIAHFSDAWSDPDYSYPAMARLGGYRAIVVVPLMREGELVGIFSLGRPEPDPFTESQIKLTQSFADQAVIAIENARLFEEVQAKTRDLEQSLDRQTATSEILRVISKSPTNSWPVFDRIVETAVRVLRCEVAVVVLCEGDAFLAVAAATTEGLDPEVGRAPVRVPIDPEANFPSRAITQKALVHLPDWSLVELPEHERAVQEKWGINSALYLPLLREGECIGALALVGKRANNFGPSEIAQAASFCDQALIAIENARLFNETKEALERQTATSNVLKVISGSVSDAAPVFEAILQSCQRLFGLERVAIYLVEGDMVKGVAQRGWDGSDMGNDATPLQGSSTGQAIAERRAIHFPDLADKPDLPERYKAQIREQGGLSVLYAPMLSEERGVGSIVVSRTPAKPFSDKEIALVQSFADQAAIAIQNTRLFNETQEALERQTATSEILRAIANSPSDAQPVFESIVVSAVKRLRCDLAVVMLSHDKIITPVAAANPKGLQSERGADHVPIDWNHNFPSRAVLGKETYYVPDWSVPDLPPHERNVQKKMGLYSAIFMPLVRNGKASGVLTLGRNRPSSFDASDISQAEGFRDQAIIALENARLFNETKEALEQQKASADVLDAIGKSVSDATPVFEAILDACQQLFAAEQIDIFTVGEDQMVRAAASRGPIAEEVRRYATPLAESVTGRVVRERRLHRIPNSRAEPNLSKTVLDRAERFGGASLIYAPMLWEDSGLGSIAVSRSPPRPFSDREQALLKTFADQAAIAIQNARLFNETQEALKQQTATADVLKVISRSAFDLQTVLDTLVSSAASLCGAIGGAICVREGDHYVYRAVAGTGANSTMANFLLGREVRPERSMTAGRALLSGEIELIPDTEVDLEFVAPEGLKSRALLAIPMLRDGRIEGVFSLGRAEQNSFTQRHIDLAQTFADQAVIAIENARLIRELQARTRELEQSLDDLRKAQDRLVQSEKLASLGQLTAGIAHEIKNPLNFVNNFSALSRELLDELTRDDSDRPV